MFDCSLWVLVHAWIDTLMHLHSYSLLPSDIMDWVIVIAVGIHEMSTFLYTSETSCECCHTFFLCSFHRTILPSVDAHEHCLFCRRSTTQETYCCQVGTLSPCVASITILAVPRWAPTEYEWHESCTSFHLGCDPSLQVWLWEGRRQDIRSHI